MKISELEKICKESAEIAQAKVKEMKSPEDIKIDWSEKVQEGLVKVKEQISTSDGGKAYVQKITYDAYRGRENMPLLYKELYTTQVNAAYPELITAKEMGPVQVVFLRVTEGGSVKFGTLKAGIESVVKFYTYAAGIEITQDMIEYNKTWEITDVAVAFGENYNKLLNHLHLSPIIGGSYTTTGGGLAGQKTAQEDEDAPVAQLIAWDTDLKKTLRNALQILPRGTWILANSADQFVLEEAIVTAFYGTTNNELTRIPTTVQRMLSPSKIIYYDGEEVRVGDKVYTYDGVTAGYAYLIVPKVQFQEKIKHDLRMEALSVNPRRLVQGGQVGVTRRATYYKLGGKYGAIKIDIAA